MPQAFDMGFNISLLLFLPLAALLVLGFTLVPAYLLMTLFSWKGWKQTQQNRRELKSYTVYETEIRYPEERNFYIPADFPAESEKRAG